MQLYNNYLISSYAHNDNMLTFRYLVQPVSMLTFAKCLRWMRISLVLMRYSNSFKGHRCTTFHGNTSSVGSSQFYSRQNTVFRTAGRLLQLYQGWVKCSMSLKMMWVIRSLPWLECVCLSVRPTADFSATWQMREYHFGRMVLIAPELEIF